LAVLGNAVAAYSGCFEPDGYLVRGSLSRPTLHLRLVLGYFAVLLFVGLIQIRLVARGFFASRYRAGAVRKAVIVGSGPLATEIARKIECHPELLWEVAGFLCPAENAPNLPSCETEGASIQLKSVGIADLLWTRAIDELKAESSEIST
jgi:hypothetical protein